MFLTIHRFARNIQWRAKVCFFVLFSEIAALMCSSAVSWSVYAVRLWIKCAECGKGSGMIPELSVKYTVPNGKMNRVPTQVTLWENAVRLRYNEIQCKAL